MDLRPPSGLNYYRPLTAATLAAWAAVTPADAESVLIDLSLARFVDPMGLATIAAVAEDAKACGRGVEFVAPQDASVRSYISRMHLGECLGRFCSHIDLPRVNERDTGHRLFELQRFDAGSSDDLAESVFRALRVAGQSQLDAASFFRGVSEVVSNVVEHSGVNGGWAVMQVMPNNEGLITFAVADAGDGLEHTVSRYNQVTGPVDAMALAFERAVSGTGAHGRGTGLDDLLQRVKRHHGQLRAWSGGAAGHSAGGPLACRTATAAFPGTVIYAGFRPQLRRCC